MLKNSYIILPDPQKSEEICDFIAQTADFLSKNNHVVMIKEENPIALKELFARLTKKNNSKSSVKARQYSVVRPLFFLPFTRFKIITNANYFLFYFIFQMFLVVSNIYYSRKIIFWYFFPPTYRSIFPQFWVHFDCVDIHPEKGMKPVEGGKTQQLLNRANSISCIAMSQKKFLQGLTSKTIQLVPQGFALPDFVPDFKTRYFRKTTKPVIGFVGALSDRIDYKLLLDLVSNNPRWKFKFWGPVQVFYTNPEQVEDQVEELKKCKNVFMMGSIPRVNLYQKMKNFDIGIIPYETNSVLNQYCYPMKLFEYFYCGLPIIATPISELKRFPKLVTIASGAQEWILAIESILSNSWSKTNQNEQIEVCKNNIWQRKINSILSAIDKNMV